MPDSDSSPEAGAPDDIARHRDEGRIGHAIDGVERAIEGAEERAARRVGMHAVRAFEGTLKVIAWSVVGVYFALGLAAVAARYWWLPRADALLRPTIEREVSTLLGRTLKIGRIDATWTGLLPRLRMQGVELLDADGATAAALPQAEAEVSWRSLVTLQPVFTTLTLEAPELSVRRLPGGRYEVAGFTFDPAAEGDTRVLDWLLEQPHLAVRDGRVHYVDVHDGQRGAVAVDLDEVNFVSRRTLGGHQLALQARPPADLSDKLDVRVAFTHPWLARASDFRRWAGHVYAQFDFADLARVAALVGPVEIAGAPLAVRRAQGALRLWLDFSNLESRRLRADVAATDVDVKLGAELEPLVLASLSGRVTQQPWGGAHEDGQEIQLTHFALEQGERLQIAPTDLTLRWAQPLPAPAGAAGATSPRDELAHGQFEAGHLSLAQLDELARHLPLPRDVHDAIARSAVAGDLTQMALAWQGDPTRPQHFSFKTRFSGLSIPADAAPTPEGAVAAGAGDRGLHLGRPGFEQLSGSIDATETGGTLALDSRNATLELPGLFDDPKIPAATLAATVRWKRGDHLAVSVDGLQFSNPDIDFSLAGSWMQADQGPGVIDLSGRVNRAEVNRTSRYFPRLPSAAPVQRWLDLALRGGVAGNGTVRLHGDLRDFPFVDPRRGEFKIATHVTGASLDYLPQALSTNAPGAGAPRAMWPAATGIDLDLAFDRDRVLITSGQGTIDGVGLNDVHLAIAPLGAPDTRLTLDGEANGPLADMLRYVNTSPVGEWIGRSLAGAQGDGNARLHLKLGIPLGRVREPATVAGTVYLAGNDVHLAPYVAPLAHATGQVEFTERSLRILGVEAGFLDGQVRIDGLTAPDGAIKISASGTTTPQGAKRQVEVPVVQRLLDRAQGSLHYAAAVTILHGQAQVAIDSDLVGVGIDLPPPMRKAAADAMPLHVEILPRLDEPHHDTIQVSAGHLVGVRFDRLLTERGEARIERGAIGIGTPATLPELGVIANIDLPQLDVDQWLPVIGALLAPPAAGAGRVAAGDGGATPDFVNARVDTLSFNHKIFSHVVLGASRADNGAWNANVQSDHISGAVNWSPGEGNGPGRVSARLARLAIPDSQREQVAQMIDAPQAEMPSLDIVADDFELGNLKLGRLELAAPSSAGSWRIEKLDIANPDGHFSASAERSRDAKAPAGGEASRRMAMTLSVDFADAGKLLARFGIPGTLRGGSGRLDGDLNWIGSPFSIDYPSLAGTLHLKTDKGQFLKAAPGVARLLGVLSLQSLPHRIGLDFRDIFSEGFAFDTITADASIRQGVIATSNFRMRGLTATVLIEGNADLRAETQNLHVLVLPVINAGSASLVYALLANPAIGLGTFLAQLVLKDPLSKVFSFEYDVSGPWADPQVVRRDRFHSDSTPQQAQKP
ncbi:MAG TPA: YhdP family protein [Burkholderiaceae bacterium]|nr:YhdP family protein [Burkholderiaceae bacterium]